jgi:hypothetical protein
MRNRFRSEFRWNIHREVEGTLTKGGDLSTAELTGVSTVAGRRTARVGRPKNRKSTAEKVLKKCLLRAPAG